ncbi:MAG: hypothetical protein NTZ83_06330, partial [Candidatus Pacearchaeota archaeon]|nr:hypothetical protein [Candidatus Pacearchaeota archaeon]
MESPVIGGGGAGSNNTLVTHCYSANAIHDYITTGSYSDGTGIQLFNSDNSTISIKNSHINNNTVNEGLGGGLYWTGESADVSIADVSIENSTINYNTAGYGGGLFCFNTKVNIVGSSII